MLLNAQVASHAKAVTATQEGRFKREIVPLKGKVRADIIGHARINM